jgi:hypothetical protein
MRTVEQKIYDLRSFLNALNSLDIFDNGVFDVHEKNVLRASAFGLQFSDFRGISLAMC